MSLSSRYQFLGLFLSLTLLLGAGCATRVAEPAFVPAPLDAAKGVASDDGKTLWFDALDLGIENQGWKQLKQPYDRLPPEAEGAVPNPVWALSHHSAGLCVRFVTDSSFIAARWALRESRIAMPHMPATGVSGLDLYVKDHGAWGWIGNGRPDKQEGTEAVLVSGLPSGMHEYMMYLPLYNGVEFLKIGVGKAASMSAAPQYPPGRAKPILFWGTSILQGGCASRPGMAYPSIIGRHMQRPTINLGFSGNGRMDPPLTALIAKLDVAAYVIDCAPNMTPELITERTEPLVRTLREAHADTPIVLVENIPYQQAWFIEKKAGSYEDKNAALRAAYNRLKAAGVKQLYYVPCTDLYGHDHEATVDGTHATDVGFLRQAGVIEPVLRKILD